MAEVTVKDIAKRAAVSVTTVSRVLNNSGYVSEKTRRRVEQALRDLHYQPNELARSLIRKQSRNVVLVSHDIGSMFFTKLVRGIEEVIHEAGYRLLICNSGNSIAQEEDYLKAAQESRVAGILIIPVTTHCRELQALSQRGFPVVTVARKVEDAPIDSVTADNEGGAFRCIRHLVELGHTRIGVINGLQDTSTGRDRWLGVKRAFDEFGISYNRELVRYGDFTIKSGYEQTLALMDSRERPTGIFVANNLMVAGTLQALHDRGFSVPDDVSVVAFEGFDDLDFGLLIKPPLTANIHPTAEMGRVGARLLLERIEEKQKSKGASIPFTPQEIRLKNDFVIRDSCRRMMDSKWNASST